MATYPGQALPLPGPENKALNKYKATGSWSYRPSVMQIHCCVGTAAPGASTVGRATVSFLFLKATSWEFCDHVQAQRSKMTGPKSHSPWWWSKTCSTSVGPHSMCSFIHTSEMKARLSGGAYRVQDGGQSTQPLFSQLTNGKEDFFTSFYPVGLLLGTLQIFIMVPNDEL